MKPSEFFLKGLISLGNIWGNPEFPQPQGFRDDAKNIEKDWQAVRNDLWKAIEIERRKPRG